MMENEKRNVSDPFGALINRLANIAAMAFVMAMCQVAAGHTAVATLTIQKSFVKLIDTGLENMDPQINSNADVVWIDDHRFMASVATEKKVHDPRVIGRTVLYDLVKKNARELMPYARPYCWNGHDQRAGFVIFSNPEVRKSPKFLLVDVDQQFNIVNKRELLPENFRSVGCNETSPLTNNLIHHDVHRLRSGDGDIDLGVSGNGLNEQAVFITSDKKRIELPLKGRQVREVLYLPFLNQYQLHLGAGCSTPGDKCPPDMHLVDREGKVTIISIPYALYDIISKYSSVYVVKNGLLFASGMLHKNSGYFLLRDGSLHQLWKPGSAGFVSPEPQELWGGTAISPDGCKVAFTRGHRPRRIFVFDHCAVGK